MIQPMGGGAGARPTAPAGPRGDDDARLRKACADFEGVFMARLFAEMRQTVSHDGLLDGGAGEEMFTSMMDEHVAASATGGDRGIGAAIYRQLRGLLPSLAANSKVAPSPSPDPNPNPILEALP